MLSIVIPTLGRPTLARTVFSFLHQLADGDEVILVADPKGDIDYVKWMHESSSSRLGVDWRYIICGDTGGWGQPQRNRGYEAAKLPNHIWFLADDDIATPGALALLRGACHDRWSIFRVGRGDDQPWMWADAKTGIRAGNLDADCILAPVGIRAHWGLDYVGDVAFARDLESELGPPVWRSEVIAVTKPSPEYLASHYQGLSGSIPWTAAVPGP